MQKESRAEVEAKAREITALQASLTLKKSNERAAYQLLAKEQNKVAVLEGEKAKLEAKEHTLQLQQEAARAELQREQAARRASEAAAELRIREIELTSQDACDPVIHCYP